MSLTLPGCGIPVIKKGYSASGFNLEVYFYVVQGWTCKVRCSLNIVKLFGHLYYFCSSNWLILNQ